VVIEMTETKPISSLTFDFIFSFSLSF
jgi:hypothetical protein